VTAPSYISLSKTMHHGNGTCWRICKAGCHRVQELAEQIGRGFIGILLILEYALRGIFSLEQRPYTHAVV